MKKPNITHEELLREISKQNFENEEEVSEFMKKMMGGEIKPRSPNKSELAQDLVQSAYSLPFEEAQDLVGQALKLDPKCVDVYVFKGDISDIPEEAYKHYSKAIKLAKKELKKKNLFEEGKGHFWMIHETRPFMSAKHGLILCLSDMDKKEEAISECKEMLELNPGDNQGIRYLLSTLLLQTKKYDDFETMIKEREEDSGTDWLYNLALYKFIKTGKSKSSNEALLKAYKKNKFVIDILLGKREISNESSDYVTLGSEEEAGFYVGHNGNIWIGIENSFDWIYNFQETRKRIN